LIFKKRILELCCDIGSTTTKKVDPENVGVAVGIFSLCALELDICLGVLYSLPLLPVNVAKNRCRDRS